MDRGAWQAMVHRVTKSPAQLSTPHPLRGGRRWAGKRCLEERGMGNAGRGLVGFGPQEHLEPSLGGRDWGQEEKGTTEDEMVGWHH